VIRGEGVMERERKGRPRECLRDGMKNRPGEGGKGVKYEDTASGCLTRRGKSTKA